jgi:hypothetical protein
MEANQTQGWNWKALALRNLRKFMPYETDKIANLYNDLENLQGAIRDSSLEVKTLGQQKTEAACDYEEAKNKSLILMKAEEDESEGKLKRTESIREAIYRTEHQDLRRKWLFLVNKFDTEKIYLDTLQSQVMGLQTRIRLIEYNERNHSGRGSN